MLRLWSRLDAAHSTYGTHKQKPSSASQDKSNGYRHNGYDAGGKLCRYGTESVKNAAIIKKTCCLNLLQPRERIPHFLKPSRDLVRQRLNLIASCRITFKR